MLNYVSLADVISLLNIGFGFLAIFILCSSLFFIGHLQIHMAFSFILLALLADGLDGIIARRTKTGELGEYIESMADMTSMAIAPTIFIYASYKQLINQQAMFQLLFIIAFFIYLFLGVIRLASFHKMKNNDFFIGLPASAATMILLVLAYIKIPPVFMLTSIFIISMLLISSIPFPKNNKHMSALATLFIILAIIFGIQVQSLFLYLLLICVLFYAIGGPFFIIYKKKNRKTNPK